MSKSGVTVSVNGRNYRWPERPLVVVCIDGSEPDYIERAVAGGHMPFTKGMLARGADLRVDSVVPSFTNPNNLSIVTGRPPAVHGISVIKEIAADAMHRRRAACGDAKIVGVGEGRDHRMRHAVGSGFANAP